MADLWKKGRELKTVGGVREWFATEEGKHYRGMSQDERQILNHVKTQNALINNGKKKRKMGYRGSIPFPLQNDWLNKNHYTWDQLARNEDRCKEKMMKHFSGPDYRGLWANDYRRPR